ncbi:MAG: hypothetical protein ACLR0U_11335 [Enterocloster clostridioformis]
MTKLLSKKATGRLIDKQLSEIFFDGRGWYVFLCVDGGGGVFLAGISVVFSNPSLYETQASPELCPCSSISISISTIPLLGCPIRDKPYNGVLVIIFFP